MPYISQVAVGRLPLLRVTGSDYDTQDGTGIRDYIHVADLARGHVKALEKILKENSFSTYNLGTGKGVSVLELLRAFEKASGRALPYELAPRRDGDLPVCYSDPSLAKRELGWQAELGLDEMCEDAWRWQSQNPNGY
jgi:UDP-glucose 4-epimerase